MTKEQLDLRNALQSIAHIILPDKNGADIGIDSRCPEADTPLHIFVWRDELENVQLLLRSGADVNAIGDMGQTPLHIAVDQQSLKIINVLINSGANPHIRSEFGTTAFEDAKDIGGEVYRLIKSYCSR